ncbi:MAG TPA: hypothetical protein VFB84_15975 [Micromonosporaceae bacterium]|nr:hypothetical protein [Micromonosporaceae bacterium]
MTHWLSYSDAVKLLGGRNDKTVHAIDRLTGGLLLVASAAGGGFVPNLFDPAARLARLSGDLVAGLGERLSGVGRYGRSERLVAAHTIIVLTAYFEAVSEARLPFDARKLELTRSEQIRIGTGETIGSHRIANLGTTLLRAGVPAHAPQWPYELTLATLKGFYLGLSDKLYNFISGLVVWDHLDETQRHQLRDVLGNEVPGRAVARYEELFRQFAIDFPEVAFWANLAGHRLTREQLQQLSSGLAGLERALVSVASGRVPDKRRLALARAYEATLEGPILVSEEAPQWLRIPSLAEAYVNPNFRVADAEEAEQLANEGWWASHKVRDDLQEFLVGYLTALESTQAPLLVLGQPGSGKSVLARVLAARLPSSDFLVVNVALREVPAEADIQTQIEHAVRLATGETISWPDLARSADGALPVVLLDGFDELLQTTGVSQSDYLEKVAQFQRRERDQGRPVAVAVTSRTAVADRARSVWGMVAIRLEPFRDSQVRQWLQVWNNANTSCLAARGLRPLPPERVLVHAELAAQPLLLLMLAVYDANSNALQREDVALGHADLYERLLTSFAEREVGKTAGALPVSAFANAVEQELMRLSIVAFAMFNRNRQWATEAELDADLTALLGDIRQQRRRSDLRAQLTEAEVVIGRFFFVHEAQATRDGSQLRTYEFLHATFGEYLVGRLVVRELSELAETAELHTTRSRLTRADDAFLHALLSFSALTTRATVVSFITERLTTLSPARRQLLRELLLDLFHEALGPRHSNAYDDYQPYPAGIPARHAAYSANLTLLAVLVGGEVTSRDLFPDSDNGVEPWRRMALLWRSQLSPTEGWNGLVHMLDLTRGWEDGRRVVRLSRATDDEQTPPIDLRWTYGVVQPMDPGSSTFRWRHYSHDDLRRHSYFLCDRADDTTMHVLEPFTASLDPTVATLHTITDGRAISPANALITLWLAAGERTPVGDLVAAYQICLSIILHGFFDSATLDAAVRESYCSLVFRQLAADRDRLPAAWVEDAVRQITAAAQRDRSLLQLARDLLADAE